jgi:predicted site-specific integrase-resolvase
MDKTIYTVGKFSKLVGKSIRTLQRWDKAGILVAHRSTTNRRFYTQDQYDLVLGLTPEQPHKKVVCYSRVSGNDQKNDLESQKSALSQFVIANGLAVNEWLSDIGSGLNYKRKNFNQILEGVERREIGKIVIAHKDRWVRFGYEWFEDFCKRHDCELVVINVETLSPEQEVVKDLLTIIHCFSSRLYGLRRYKKEVKTIVEAHENDQTL